MGYEEERGVKKENLMKLNIYTDGACSGNPGPGGWAIVFFNKDKTISYSGYKTKTTNNEMELFAVVKALQKISKSKNDYEFAIFSDSAYVINAISLGWIYRWQANGWKTSRGDEIKNKELWQKLISLLSDMKEDKTILFNKVKGHSGNTFNELADNLARKQSGIAAGINKN